jgi:hypothetical protein
LSGRTEEGEEALKRVLQLDLKRTISDVMKRTPGAALNFERMIEGLGILAAPK